MAYRTSSYGDYLSSVCSLYGVDVGDLETTETTFLNTYFRRALRKIWESQRWRELCPTNEVRFLDSNLLSYPNDYTQSAYWTGTGVTITPAALANPLDGRLNGQLFTETAGTSLHGVSQAAAFVPDNPYVLRGFFRPNGRNYLYINVYDGVNSYAVMFNGSQPSPAVVSAVTSGASGAPTGSIQATANGWFTWTMNFTSANAATAGTVYVSERG